MEGEARLLISLTMSLLVGLLSGRPLMMKQTYGEVRQGTPVDQGEILYEEEEMSHRNDSQQYHDKRYKEVTVTVESVKYLLKTGSKSYTHRPNKLAPSNEKEMLCYYIGWRSKLCSTPKFDLEDENNAPYERPVYEGNLNYTNKHGGNVLLLKYDRNAILKGSQKKGLKPITAKDKRGLSLELSLSTLRDMLRSQLTQDVRENNLNSSMAKLNKAGR